MNATKFAAALDLLKDAIFESVISDDDWASFGRAVRDAIKDSYDVSGVVGEKQENKNWRPAAINLWKASRKVGVGPR